MSLSHALKKFNATLNARMKCGVVSAAAASGCKECGDTRCQGNPHVTQIGRPEDRHIQDDVSHRAATNRRDDAENHCCEEK